MTTEHDLQRTDELLDADTLISVVSAAVMVLATRINDTVSSHWLRELATAVDQYAPGLVADTQALLRERAYAEGADD